MNGSGVSSKLFVIGIVLGVSGGIVVGSILGMQIGEKSIGYLRRRLNRFVKPKRSVRFDLLLQ
ncbi:MAG: hypothetical protein Q7O66_02370 [Dehalococcoidia bacterium]|nr:hypothetical protein [Dehalococcoidia bacterium]